jgi:archaellum component FlaC
MIQSQMRKQEADCKAQLTRTKVLCDRREKELADYQSEVLKVIRGESQLSTTVINELIEKAESALQDAKKDKAHWTEELDSIQQKTTDMHKLYGKVVSWSELFDTCNMAEKKMIVSQLIRQVRVWKDYRIEIDFNVNIEQLLTYQQLPLSA